MASINNPLPQVHYNGLPRAATIAAAIVDERHVVTQAERFGAQLSVCS
jgi:hypothetical protein